MSKEWYKKWHDSHHHGLIHWAILILILSGIWFMLSSRIQDWIDLNEPGITVRLSRSGAQLFLSPKTRTVLAGDTFSVDIVLDTGNQPVDGVDIYSLHYDPTLLTVMDDVASQPGVQITPGNIMDINVANEVSSSTGSIKYSQISSGGTNFIGSGTLATIHFRAIGTGTAYLKFDFEAKNTIDTNAAYKGKDQLARVVDGIYIIKSK